MKSLVASGLLTWAVIAAQGAAEPASDDGTHTFRADNRYLVLPSGRRRIGPTRLSIEVEGKPYLAVANTLITATEPVRIAEPAGTSPVAKECGDILRPWGQN